MATYPTLTCALRTTTGSNATRQLRHQGMLPATVYGHGAALSLKLSQQHFATVERACPAGSALVSLCIDGKEGGLALVKDVQRDSIKRQPIHLELQRISLQEQLHVDVAVVLEGDAAGVLEGGMLDIALHALHLRCAAGNVPETVTHDISAMQIGDTLAAKDFVLPEGCELMNHPDECVAVIRQQFTPDTETAVVEEAATE